MITLLGSLQLFIPAIYDKVILGNPLLVWSTESVFIYALCTFFALVLDSLDGCHARYTGFYSAGGFLMDHGTDFIKIPVVGWYVSTLTSGTNDFLNLFIIYATHAGLTFSVLIMYNALVTGKYELGGVAELQMVAILMALTIWFFKAFLLGGAVDRDNFNSVMDTIIVIILMFIYFGYFASIFTFELPTSLRASFVCMFVGTAWPIIYYYFFQDKKLTGNGDLDAQLALLLMYIYALIVIISSILMLSKRLEVSFSYYTTGFLVVTYILLISLKSVVFHWNLGLLIAIVVIISYIYVLYVVYKISRYENKYFLFVHNRYEQFKAFRAMKDAELANGPTVMDTVNLKDDVDEREKYREMDTKISE